MAVAEQLHDFNRETDTLGLRFEPSVWSGYSRISSHGTLLPAVRIHEAFPVNPELSQMILAQIGTILGIKMDAVTLEEIKKKAGTGVSSLFTRAGWGHSLEAYMVALGFENGGIPVVFGQADGIVEIINPAAYRPNAAKIEAHNALQMQQEVFEFLEKRGLADKKDGMYWKAMILDFYFSLGNLAAGTAENNGVADVNTPLERLLSRPIIYRQFIKFFQQLNFHLSDKAIGKVVAQFLSEMGCEYVYTSMPGISQGLKNIVASHVDVGYPRNPDGSFNPGGSMEVVSVDPDQLTVVPDQVTAGIVNDYFGHKKTIWVGDNVGPVDLENHLGKWRDEIIDTDRRILLSTSGHGANADELSDMVDQYVEYQRLHLDSPYTCVVFVGDHLDNRKNEKINALIEKVSANGGKLFQSRWDENIEEFEARVRAVKGLVLVGTEDMIQTARVKHMLQNEAHVEAVKSGESHTMNPHRATATYLLKPSPPNEPFNGIYALTRGGSFARHPIWRDYLHNYYKHQGLTDEQIQIAISQIPGLEKGTQETNFFDELDLNFKSGRIRQEAMRGALNITNSTVPTMALVIANALGIDLDEAKRQEIQAQIAEYHISERVRKQSIIESLYPQITEGFSNRREEAYQRLTPEHPLVVRTVGIGMLAIALAFVLRKKRKNKHII